MSSFFYEGSLLINCGGPIIRVFFGLYTGSLDLYVGTQYTEQQLIPHLLCAVLLNVWEIWVPWFNELMLYDGAGLNQFPASSCAAATSNCMHLIKCIWKVQCYGVGNSQSRVT